MCLARMGNFQEIREILSINEIPQEPVSDSKKISEPLFNYLITDILSDPFARSSEFGFYSVLNLPFPCAAKTGTSFRFCDNWTVGYTKDYTLGVWVGNFDRSSMMKVSGITGAGPIFANVMYSLYQNKKLPEKIPPNQKDWSKLSSAPFLEKKPGPFCPSHLEEIIPLRDLADYEHSECHMHKPSSSTKARTVVPTEFKKWATPLGIEIIPSDQAAQPLVKIVHPQNRAVYYRLSNLRPEFQSIRFQAECSQPSVALRWLLNDQLLQKQVIPMNSCGRFVRGALH